MRNWISYRKLCELYDQWKGDYLRVPEDVRVKWQNTLLYGWALVTFLLVTLLFVVRYLYNHGHLNFEEQLVRDTADAIEVAFSTAVYIETIGNAFFTIPICVIATVIAIKKKNPITAASIFAGFVTLAITVMIGWFLWERPRPEFVEGGLASPGFSSFPSGHVAQTIMLYGFLTYLWVRLSTPFWEKFTAVALCTILLSFITITRLELGTHWPSDVVAGLLIGVVWLAILVMAHKNAVKRLLPDAVYKEK